MDSIFPNVYGGGEETTNYKKALYVALIILTMAVAVSVLINCWATWKTTDGYSEPFIQYLGGRGGLRTDNDPSADTLATLAAAAQVQVTETKEKKNGFADFEKEVMRKQRLGQ